MRFLALAAALAAVSCQGDTAAPRSVRQAAFSFAPAFATRAADVVPFDRVRVTLSRSSGIALDTTVAFPADADSLVLRLSTPINGASETLTLDLAMINAAGDTVFRGGPLPVTLTTEAGAGAGGPGVTIPVRYSGVGANARNVRIATRSASVFFRDTVALSAAALDSSGAPIPGTPIAWRSLDTALARIPSDTSGRVVGGVARGVARIEASLPTGQADTALVTVQPVPAALAVLSGAGQSAPAGTGLPQPVVFRVTAADSAGVQGLAVTIAVASGGGTVGATTDTTNANGDVTVAWTLGALLGTQSITATVAASPSLTATATATGIVGPPKKLAFQVQPSGVAANVAIAPAVTVLAQDSLGNTATAFTGTVTLALGANPGSATLGGTVSVQAVAGVATFGTLSLNLPGTGYTLVASATGLASASSTLFDVSGGVPARLAFGQQPAGGSAGTPIAPAVTVRVEDTNGNLVPSATTAVTIALGANPGHGTLGGTTTANAVAGVATFAGLVIDSAGAGYTLTAGATGLTGATSAGFTIAAGAAKQLAFTTAPPASLAAGAAFGVAVTAQDALGNTATGFNGNVTVAITGGTGTAGAALRGTATVAAVAGVATFTGLSVDSVGAGYTLTATAVGPSAATSAAFAVVSAPAIRLAFTTQPAPTTAGTGFGVVVTALDSLGNVAKGFAGAVAVALTPGTGTAGAALRGTTSATAAAGVATFSGLSVDSAGSGFRLRATASGLPADTSAAFGVAPAPASRLAFTLQPPAGATAGATFSVVVAARDSLGNVAVAFGGTVSLAITAGTGTAGAALRGTTAVSAASGLATFGGLSVDSAGAGYTLTATASGLANGVSTTFDVGAAAATQLVFTTEPASTTAGTPFGVVVTARDALGNTATGFGGPVTVAITAGTGKAGASLRGVTSVAAVAGVATFTGLSVDSAGTGYTLSATAAGPATAISSAFAVAPAPATHLVFTGQPANTAAGATFGVVVAARDSLGNTATSFTGSVTVAITPGTGKAGAALRGPTTVSATAGVASFGGLSVDSVGTGYTLTASATGPASGASTAFDVGAAPATQLVFTTQPANTTAGTGFAVVVTARDSLGNTATGFAGNVTVALTAGTGTAGAALRGTTTMAAVAGVAAFSGLSVDSAGAGYSLTATAASAGTAGSSTFDVAAAPASRLAFTVQPSNTTAGVGFGVAVTARDSLGNTATGFGGNVTVAITGGTGTPGATLRGATTVAASSGVATFSALSIDSAGTGYTLTATGAGSATSSTFSVAAAPAVQLVFTTQPANTTAGVGFGVVVQARDSLGNTAVGFGGTITVTIGTGTGTAGASLRGTTAVPAGAGVATFAGLSIDSAGTGYHLTASATGPGSATSTAFDVAAAPASRLVFTAEPPGSTTAGAAFGVTVTALDSLGNRATGFGGTVAVAITNGTGTAGASLRGSTSVPAGSGVATFSGLSVDSAGTSYTLTASAAGPASGASAPFAITAGSAATLAFTTQPPLNTPSQAPFGFTVAALDAVGNVATGFSGSVAVAITTNPAGGTLTGPVSRTAVSGVATFSGLSIDNIGSGYRLTASATGPSPATSAPFNIVAAAHVNAWINPAGGNWSVASNWSMGAVPTALDTVTITQSGTYTVNVDVNAAFARLDAGAPSGTQTLAIAANTLTAGNGAFGLNTVLSLSGSGSIAGSGTLAVAGAFDWTGGSLGGGGTIQVLAGGTLSIAPAAAVTFQAYTLELAGAGTWTGTATVNSGSGAVLRVASGATLDIQGDPTFAFNLGGATPALDVLGTLTRTSSANPAVLGVAVNDSGTVSVQSGTLRLGGGGASSGSYAVSTGATLEFNGGTHVLAAGSSVSGAGTVSVTGGTVTFGGGYTLTGTTQVAGGTANVDGAAASTGALAVSSGTLGGSGLLAVGGAMSWTGGTLSGAGGTTRVLSSGTLALAPAAAVSFQAYTLELDGSGTWTGTSTVNSGSGAVLRVASGGTLDIQGDPTFAFSLGGAIPALDVLGTLTRTSSSNPAVLGVAVNDSGTVSVQSGTLRLGGGGTSSGAYAAASGATLDFSGGTHSLAASSSIGGAGTVSFSGGTTNAGGAYAVTGATVVAGGVANLNGGSNSTAALTVTSGALGGSGLLTVSGAMSWTGGNLSGAGGTTQVLPSGTLGLAPAGNVSLQGYTLELDGTGTWTGTATVNSGSGAVLRVASGGTLDIQGDPNFAFSLGGATSLFDDQGTVNRTTSLNAAVVNAPFTLAGTLSLQSGLLTLVQGGTLSGTATLAGITDLELAGGTFTLANNFRETGTGLVVTLGGTLGGLAASDTAFFDNLQLGGGTVSLSGGTIKTAVQLTWNQSTSVAGGTLYVPAGAALNLGIIGAASLSAATILNAGSAAFTTSGTLNSGSGAVIRNLPGGSFAFSAPGSYLFSLGGATSLFDNQGTLSAAPASGAAVVSAAFSNSGTLQVLLDTLRLAGGASGTFPGTVSVASGAVLDLGGGTFTLGSALPIGGSLRVSGGALVPNGHPVAVTGNFATAGAGALQMTLAADSLDVGGTATFGGGAGTLSAGALTLRGDFVQTTNATAFAATGTQHVYFSGAGTQNISFANPTTSFFRRLEIPAILHNVVLQTNVQVTDSLNMLAGGSAATMLGAGTSQRLTVGGLLTLQQSTSSPKLTPPVLELSVAPAVSTTPGTLSPDTTVFLGGIATLPTGAGISYKSIRVGTTGAMTVPANVTIPGDLVVSSGTFSIPDKTTFSAGGKLRTSGSGVLATPGGASVMVTGDSAIFGGGSESGQLTAGQLQVGGNFVQLGSGGQFAATGSQRTVLDRAAAGVQTIQFADSVNSFFHDLVLSRTTVDTVRLLSNVQVQDSAIVSAASVLASTAQEALKLPLAGILRVHSQAVLKPFRVEAGTWVLDSTFLGGNAVRFRPDTAVALNGTTFNGGSISSSPAPLFAWKSLRLESGTLTSTGTSYGGDLVVEGTARYALSTAGVTDSIAGKLRTLGTAAIEMNVGTAPPTIAVGDSALFGGGSELDLLASGILRLYGSFVQSGNTQSFYATTGHTTVFAGSGKQTVTFANPGTSTFGNLAIERSVGGVSQSAGITLGSTVTVSGLLEDSTFAGGVTDSIFGNGNGLVAGGLSLGSQFVMNDAPLATTGSALVFSGLTFRNMSPTVTQWTIELPSGAQAAVSGLTFQTAPTTGLYFDARVLTSGTATLLVSGGSPPTLSAGQYNRTANGTVTVSWNGSSLP